jgi:hypothetical protein
LIALVAMALSACIPGASPAEIDKGVDTVIGGCGAVLTGIFVAGLIGGGLVIAFVGLVVWFIVRVSRGKPDLVVPPDAMVDDAVGAYCCVCGEQVVSSAEAVRCPGCRAVVHGACAPRHQHGVPATYRG